jgi:hypothetical protein
VRQRFLLPLYPFVFLGVAAGADVVGRWFKKLATRWPRFSFLPIVGAVAALVLAVGPWRMHTASEAREVQLKNWGKDYAYYQAIQFAETLPGRIAFEHRSSIALALFGEPDRGRAVFADMHLDAREPERQWEQLQQWEAQYIVLQDVSSEHFPVVSDETFSQRFSLLQEFVFAEKPGKRDVAHIFQVRRE